MAFLGAFLTLLGLVFFGADKKLIAYRYQTGMVVIL